MQEEGAALSAAPLPSQPVAMAHSTQGTGTAGYRSIGDIKARIVQAGAHAYRMRKKERDVSVVGSHCRVSTAACDTDAVGEVETRALFLATAGATRNSIRSTLHYSSPAPCSKARHIPLRGAGDLVTCTARFCCQRAPPVSVARSLGLLRSEVK